MNFIYDNFGVCKNNGTMTDPQGNDIIVQYFW